MFIGQRLGNTIPAQLNIFRDLATDITITTRCSNKDIIRRRLVDPELISITTNINASYGLNIYEIKSGIQVQANLDSDEVRERNTKSAIDVTVDIVSDEIRQRNTSVDIEAIANLIANAERALELQSSIDANAEVDIDKQRVRLAQSDIDAKALFKGAYGLVELLFKYTKDIAVGDKVIIDTDKLTIEKEDGTNLRKYFSGEWIQIDPDIIQDLSYSDGETDRTLELVIEKEDRSI